MPAPAVMELKNDTVAPVESVMETILVLDQTACLHIQSSYICLITEPNLWFFCLMCLPMMQSLTVVVRGLSYTP